ncbi:O-antigen/teichoic acid export membrane protein [Gillisia sp. Hel_I_86]|uniref:lipopolysaccharide biosynthesis protein n=1 Tax=Gillisia sp. Hel_I_86 TaxID=1249981 RepID=UPI001199FDA0|nr:lipopolysaccharide biosynthesis protein [Gillisia sp. Hel_I_86]TVZ26049.1 O-antigen/teichoic acid export membrane protein [Gillisia sp. Hel_I_86]
MSLRKQTLSGLIWTFIDTFLVSGLFFVAMIYIARILGPKEFGLIGMISVFIAIGTSLVDSGLSSSIVRTKDADNRDFSTVFYLNLGMSFVVYLVLFLAAPWIADFFSQPILSGVIRLYCFSFIISAFSAVQLAQLNREMQFQKIAKYNVPGTLIGIAVGVILSLYGYGVWSIVWMYLTKQLVQSLILWIFSTWKPTLYFSKEKMKYHYGFGYKLMLSGLLNTVFDNIYNIVIGRYYTVQSVGYFERARTFNLYPVSTLTSIISRVTYPLLAKIQDEKERISKVYKQLLQFSFFITAPLMLGAAAIAAPLFELVLGEQWMPAVTFFQILCLSSIFIPIHSFNLNVLKVFGRSDLFLRLEIYKKLTVVIAIAISLPFGVIGLVWSSVATSFIALLINTYYSQDLINYKTGRQLLDMLPTFLIAGLVAVLMFVLVYKLKSYSLWLQIILPSIVGVLVYFGTSIILKRPSLQFGLELIKPNK